MADGVKKTQESSTIKQAKKLDAASGFLFFIGIVLCKSSYFLPRLVAPIINGIGLGFYLLGYSLWLLECYIDPRKKQQKGAWYGFVSVKQEFTASSIIGLTATFFGIASIFMPILLLPTCWLFTISNTIWCIGEYQKTKHGFDDPDYDEAKQKSYFHYVVVITILSFLNSLLTTLAMFIPILLPIALMFGPYLGGIGIKAYLDMNCFSPKKKEMKHVETHSDLEPLASAENLASLSSLKGTHSESRIYPLLYNHGSDNIGRSPINPQRPASAPPSPLGYQWGQSRLISR